MAERDDGTKPDGDDENPGQKEDDQPREVKLPKAWATAEDRGVKRWSEGSRTDDPDARKVHPPLAQGIGSGKAFFFLFGFKKSSPVDQKMLEMELAHIDDDIEVLRNAGYTVVVDTQATRPELISAVGGNGEGAAGLTPAGFYWSAHGHQDGSVECCDGDRIKPEDLDEVEVSPGLRVAIFGACYVGCRSQTWRKALGGHPLVVGWGRPVTIDRAVDFLQPSPETETDLDDLIRRFLLTDAPLPGATTERYSPVAEAAARGRIANLQERVETLADMLAAPWREQEQFLEIRVPLDGGRFHVAKVFVIDSAEPFSEGEPMLGVEADVGELSALVDLNMALAGLGTPSYARVALVESDTDMPTIVAQGFLPLARVRDQDLAALVYQVAQWADTLEERIFGGDMR